MHWRHGTAAILAALGVVASCSDSPTDPGRPIPAGTLKPGTSGALQKRQVTAEDLRFAWKNRILVKFEEGSGVRSRAGRAAIEGAFALGPRRDAELPAVARAVGTARKVLVTRSTTVSEATIAEIRAFGERRTGEQLPDLNLWLHVYVDVDTDQEVANIINALNALPIVELATPDRLPGDLPAASVSDRLPWPDASQVARLEIGVDYPAWRRPPPAREPTPPVPMGAMSAYTMGYSLENGQVYRKDRSEHGNDLAWLQTYLGGRGESIAYVDVQHAWYCADGQSYGQQYKDGVLRRYCLRSNSHDEFANAFDFRLWFAGPTPLLEYYTSGSPTTETTAPRRLA